MPIVNYRSTPSCAVRIENTKPERGSETPSGVDTANITSSVKLVLASNRPLCSTPAKIDSE